MQLPSKSPITLPFGSTDAPYSAAAPHMGTDFAYKPDNTIYAPFSGKVTLVPNNGRDGNGIYMYNGDQFHGMLHSSQYLVSNGAQVTEGQPIGIMGDTGYAFGVHLHWCVKLNGQFIDPMTLIEGEDMKLSKEEAEVLYMLAVPGQGINMDFVDKYTGAQLDDVLHALQNDPSIQKYIAALLNPGQINRQQAIDYITENLK